MEIKTGQISHNLKFGPPETGTGMPFLTHGMRFYFGASEPSRLSRQQTNIKTSVWSISTLLCPQLGTKIIWRFLGHPEWTIMWPSAANDQNVLVYMSRLPIFWSWVCRRGFTLTGLGDSKQLLISSGFQAFDLTHLFHFHSRVWTMTADNGLAVFCN